MESRLLLKDYIVLDIENPNSRGNSICSIGIMIIKDYQVIDTIYTLINPEDRFDHRNEELTGINASQVQNAPTFKEYWPKIKDLLTHNVIVGHNITYDLNVISKALNRYDIEVPNFSYACTLNLSKKYLSSASYKLVNLVSPLGFEYKPHIAIEDVKASHFLFNFIQDNFGLTSLDVKPLQFENVLKDNLDSRLESNINELCGIVFGIVSDDEVNKEEIIRLEKWVHENYQYKSYALFDKIISTINRILSDNIIDNYEKIELTKLCDSIKHSKMYNETTLGIQILQGILDGIIADHRINIKEINTLKKWLTAHDYLTGVYPYDRILKIVEIALQDGQLDANEINEMNIVFNEILNPVKECNITIDIKDKTYCLSGEFTSGPKADIRKKLNNLGGIEKSSVSSKLDYLFVGGVGSDAWKYGKFGGKISKAQELQEKGCKVQIIAEEDLL